jgi:hypothetical protein
MNSICTVVCWRCNVDTFSVVHHPEIEVSDVFGIERSPEVELTDVFCI